MSKHVMLDPGDLIAYAGFADAIISSSDNKVDHRGAVAVSAFRQRKEVSVTIQQRDAREPARCVAWSPES